MRRLLWAIGCLSATALISCSTGAPMAPLGFDKRPANTPAEVATLTTQASDNVPQSELALPPVQARDTQAPSAAVVPDLRGLIGNRFSFSDVSAPGGFMTLDPAVRANVLRQALSASTIRILCRTDQSRPSRTARAAALKRGAAVRRFLINQGVLQHKIRLYVRSTGAFVADNRTPAGRAQNRRVEILFN